MLRFSFHKLIFLSLGLGLIFVLTIGCTPTLIETVEEPVILPTNEENAVTVPMANPESSCATPSPAVAARCAAEEQQILAATVRLELHGPKGGLGHATVIAGRYLLTHNHFPVTANELRQGGDIGVHAVSVTKINGDIILLKAPLSFFIVAEVAPETLLLDFKTYGGVGFFDSVNVPSVTSRVMNAAELRPGMEVAQVDWDGTKTFVRWVQIARVDASGVAIVEIDSPLAPGASGGGVFWQGEHIANNWRHLVDRNPDSGEVLRDYNMAVLNTSTIITLAELFPS